MPAKKETQRYFVVCLPIIHEATGIDTATIATHQIVAAHPSFPIVVLTNHVRCLV